MGHRLDALLLGPSRRTRQMRKRLEALDRADARMRAAGLDPLDEWRREREPRRYFAPPPTATTRHRVRPVLLVVVVLALPLTLYFIGPGLKRSDHSGSAGSRANARPVNFPPTSHEEREHALGRPVPAPDGQGGFELERTQDGGQTPVTWDPCRPIHYVVSGQAPAGQTDLIASVVAQLSALTGLHFSYDGPTSEPATEPRAAYQPARYGSQWAPVLVAWTDAAQVPKLAGPVVGLGGANAVSLGSSWATFVTGIVFLDRPELERAAHQPGAAAELRAVVLHEFGHLLELAHVSDPGSIMFPEARLQVTKYSAGDLRGIFAVSTGRCAPNL